MYVYLSSTEMPCRIFDNKMLNNLQKIWKKSLIMLSAGVLLSLFINRNSDKTSDVFFSDMFFISSMIFLISGFTQFVSNTGMFNSLVFGTKTLSRLFKSKLGPSEKIKDEYFEFTESRKKYGDIPQLLIIGAALMLISVLLTFL